MSNIIDAIIILVSLASPIVVVGLFNITHWPLGSVLVGLFIGECIFAVTAFTLLGIKEMISKKIESRKIV